MSASACERDRCPSAASILTTRMNSVRHHPRVRSERNIFEKQVTMEDHLIQGALQILSEEAVEDISAVNAVASMRRTPQFDLPDDSRHGFRNPVSSFADDHHHRMGSPLGHPSCDTGPNTSLRNSDVFDPEDVAVFRDDGVEAGETEVLYLRSAAPCASPLNTNEVVYGSAKSVVPGSVVFVPPLINRSRYSSFSGRMSNSPISSRSVSVRTLADTDSIIARLSPERNQELWNDVEEQHTMVSRPQSTTAAISNRLNSIYQRGRSDSFPEIVWSNNGRYPPAETTPADLDSASGSPQSGKNPFTPGRKLPQSFRIKELRSRENSLGSLSRLSTLRRKLLGSSRSKSQLDAELGGGTPTTPEKPSQATPSAATHSSDSRSRNNSVSRDSGKRIPLRQLTYKSVVDSSSSSDDNVEEALIDEENNSTFDGAEDSSMATSTGYSTLQDESKKSSGKEGKTRRVFQIPSFRKSKKKHSDAASPSNANELTFSPSASTQDFRLSGGVDVDETELLVLESNPSMDSEGGLKGKRGLSRQEHVVSSSREVTPMLDPSGLGREM
ncbi:unnamed protein product [Notodromas monacha]|uniref:Uncharacterized protein n=1 Tax=Notodromas monacha TaxID=399045 RepID=A0A7R9BXS6_9CRUS|nr:unnamed protein product [Notodromas monacha]CAG0922087.1 unnamed protein product [Notodromas monacha]